MQLDLCVNIAILSQTVKIALALASGLGDPMYDTSVSEIVTKMLRYVVFKY